MLTAAILGTYVFAAGVLFLLLARVCAIVEDSDVKLVLAASITGGPALLAYVFAGLLALFPRADVPLLQVATLSSLAVGAAAAWAFNRPHMRPAIALLRSSAIDWQGAAVALVIGGVLGALAFCIPLVQNDPLEYTSVARFLCASRDLRLYPVLDGAQSGGLYAPWTHPPGYPLLLAWSLALDGCRTAEVSGLKLPGVYSLFSICAAVGLVLPQRAALYSIIVLIGTPILVTGAVHATVDPVRLAPAVGAFLLTASALRRHDGGTWLASGMLAGLALFMHSLGAVSAALTWLAAIACIDRRGLTHRLFWSSAAGAVAVAMCAAFLARNIELFGVPLGDSTRVWELPLIRYGEHLVEFRGLSSTLDRITSGLLKGWTTPFFGASWWLLLPAVLLLSRRAGLSKPWRESIGTETQSVLTRLTIAQLIAFLTLLVGTFAIGSVALLKNERYFLTIQPSIAILVGLALARSGWPQLRFGRELKRLGVISAVLACSSVLFTATYLGWWIVDRLGVTAFGAGDERERALRSALPQFAHVRYLDAHLTSNACVLLFNQAEYAFYGKGCFVSYLDHRLLSAYTAKDADSAISALAALNIRYVYVPRHALPEIQNTMLQNVLADPSRAKLVWQHLGFRIFDIAPTHAGLLKLAVLTPRGAPSDLREHRSWAMNPNQPFSARYLKCLDVTSSVRVGEARTTDTHLVVHATLTGHGLLALGLSTSAVPDGASTPRLDETLLWQGVVQGSRKISAQTLVTQDVTAARLCLTAMATPEFSLQELALTAAIYE